MQVQLQEKKLKTKKVNVCNQKLRVSFIVRYLQLIVD